MWRRTLAEIPSEPSVKILHIIAILSWFSPFQSLYQVLKGLFSKLQMYFLNAIFFFLIYVFNYFTPNLTEPSSLFQLTIAV